VLTFILELPENTINRFEEKDYIKNLREEKKMEKKFIWDPHPDKTNWLVTYNGEQYILTFDNGSWIFDKLIERDNNVFEREVIWETEGTKERVPYEEAEEYLIEYC
jgi:hypothetical protein